MTSAVHGPFEGINHADVTSRLKKYLERSDWKALWQVTSTVVCYVLGWYLMYRSLTYSYAMTLALALPTGAVALRLWALQHDLGHGSLFRSKRINDTVGSVFGVMTLLPYHHWRRIHNLHHSDFGNLDRRGPGYVTTFTVDEYLVLPWWRRTLYRIYRNPFIVLVPGSLYYFLLQHRVPYDAQPSWRRERWNVYLTNLAVGAVVVAVSAAIGLGDFLMIQLPIIFVSSSAGAWIFLCQHAFEDTYWARDDEWDFVQSALEGSSYYQLPRILQWFTASVGFHHVHHLSPRIPNYNLERCHNAIPELKHVAPLTLRTSLKTRRMALWDEAQHKMISFRDLGARGRRQADPAAAAP